MPVMSSAGVTSKAGFRTCTPFGAQRSLREPRALQVRPRLAGDDGYLLSLCRAHDAKRRAMARGGERTGVAMGHDARACRNELGPAFAERPVCRHILLIDGARLGFEIPRLL